MDIKTNIKGKCLVIMVLLLVVSGRAYAAPRIISLAPNTTEILFKLGLGGSIIGLDDFSDYPEEVNNIERLGTFNNPNMERIILLRPDYILVNSGFETSREEYLKSLGVRIIKISPKTMEGLYGDILMLGSVFGKEKDAESIIKEMKSRISGIPYPGNSAAPKVFVQLFDDPLVTVSSFISDIIRLAGGENIAMDIEDDAGIFSCEALIARNPDVILAAGFSGNTCNFKSINAVKNKRVYSGLNPDLLLRPGPRSAEAVEMLNRVFYE